VRWTWRVLAALTVRGSMNYWTIDVAADRKRHHAATGGGMEVIYQRCFTTHQLRPFLSSEEPRTVSAARTRQVQTHRSAHRGPGAAGLLGFHIPLFSQIYEGNQNDSVTFSRVLDDLVTRYQMFREKCQSITWFSIGEQFGGQL